MPNSRRTTVTGWISLTWGSFQRLLGVARSDRGIWAFVLALLAIDLFFIFFFGVGKTLHYLERYSRLYYHKEMLITTDGGVPELYTYFKTLLLVILFVRLARWTRQPIYVAFAVLFLVVLLDDALEIHEYVGRHLVRPLELRPVLGMRARDIGELITWAALGALVVPLLLFGFVRSNRRHRGNGLAYLLPFSLLLVCAAFVDQLYTSYSDVFFGAGILLDMIEDGGEMLAITALCALALGTLRETSVGNASG